MELATSRKVEVAKAEGKTERAAWRSTCSACFIVVPQAECDEESNALLDNLVSALATDASGVKYVPLYASPKDTYHEIGIAHVCSLLTSALYTTCKDKGHSALYEKAGKSSSNMIWCAGRLAHMLRLHFFGTVVATQSPPTLAAFAPAGTLEYQTMSYKLFIVPSASNLKVSSTTSPAWVVKPIPPATLVAGKVTPSMVVEAETVDVDEAVRSVNECCGCEVKSVSFIVPFLRMRNMKNARMQMQRRRRLMLSLLTMMMARSSVTIFSRAM